jgi:hypothetical protein
MKQHFLTQKMLVFMMALGILLGFSEQSLAQCDLTFNISGNTGTVIDVDQNQNNTCMAFFTQGGLAQQFTAVSNASCGAGLTFVSAATGDLTIELYTALPNAGGTLLATGTSTLSGQTEGNVTWPSTPISIGVQYYLVFTSPNITTCVAGSTVDPYPGGILYANTGFNPFTTFDYTFRHYTCGTNGDGSATTWTVTDNVGTIVLSGGPYLINGYSDSQTIVGANNGPYTYTIVSGAPNNEPDYSVVSGASVLYSGTVAGGTTQAVGPVDCSLVPLACEISVNVFSASWGDGTTWTLTDAGGNIVLSGGPYGNGYNATQTLPLASAGNYTFTVISNFSDNNPNYSISLDGDVVFSGAAPASQTTTVGPIICSPVPVPPTPVQAAGIPTCSGGAVLTLPGAPGPNTTWYWQTAPDGVSMANPGASPWTVFTNGTYYARAFDSNINAWSDPSSITISNFPLEATPQAPSAAQNPACIPGTEVTMPTPPANVVYYWQTVVNGTSQSSPTSTPLFVSTVGTTTVYVAAYNTVSQCWSPTSQTTVTVQDNVPPNVIADPAVFNFCPNESPMNISVVELPPSCPISINIFNAGWGDGTTWTVTNSLGQVVLSGGPYGNGYNDTQIIAEATESPYTLTITSQWESANYVVSVDGQTVFSGVAPAGGTTVISPFGCQIGGDDILWYSASSGGNFLGNTATINALGTSVLPIAAPGSYQFYATNILGACESAQRTLVTVNIVPVDAELIPVDNTCNGGLAGSFTLGTVNCGTAPFTYSVNGGAYGAIPTNLPAGTHTVIIQDATTAQSGPITIVVGQPGPLTDLTATTISALAIELAWTTPGDETEWTIEYGPVGFTPGTGTSVNVTTNPAEVTGLTPGTVYDFYVQSACGENADWAGPVTEATEFGCGGGFFDNGGLTGPYAASSNDLHVICPFDAGDYVEVTFTLFQTEAFWDGFYIYDGNSTAAPLISSGNPTGNGPMSQPGAWWGNGPLNWPNGVIPGPFVSSGAGACLTFNFLSDFSGQFAGFEGTIDCYPCFPTPGIDGEADVCRLTGSIDLNTVVTLNSDRGAWFFPENPGVLTEESILNIGQLPDGTYEAYYIVVTPCTADTTVATIHVFPPSSAGESGFLSNCNNGFISLYEGLDGLVDMDGQWYNPAGEPIPSNLIQVNGQLSGVYNYYYITSNGVCPADTSYAEVTLLNCVGLTENEIAGFELYPNPTADVVFLSYAGENINAKVYLVDAKGSVISVEERLFETNSTFEIKMTDLQSGVYFVTIVSDTGKNIIQVVKQ